ncbi:MULTISPECIES: YqjF family protein [Paenibacillus]|uniref:YqjF family protein n=1 Tax=Paenibacillus residui TaxID=629724 RepID=A0ABW3DFD0_9BACL
MSHSHFPPAQDEDAWIMKQSWQHVLFLHWPVPVSSIRERVPRPLTIDTFKGQAWLGVVAFRMTGIRLRGCPVPYPFSFPEVNVRTYVSHQQGPGVYFITLDASDPIVLNIAKWWYKLPYYRAKMQLKHKDGFLKLSSRRVTSESPSFAAHYRPLSAPYQAEKGTLEHWLTERYRFYCIAKPYVKIYCGQVFHPPWPLQSVELAQLANTLTDALGIHLPDEPVLLHYSRGVNARFSALHTYPAVFV